MNLPASSATPWFVGYWDTTWVACNFLTCQDCPGFLVIYIYIYIYIYIKNTGKYMWWSVLVGSTPLCLPWAHCRMSEGELYSTVGLCVQAKLLQSCPTLCNPMDCGLPGSSVRGILQARILEWVAVSSSRGSSQPRDWTQVFYVFCIGRRVLYH